MSKKLIKKIKENEKNVFCPQIFESNASIRNRTEIESTVLPLNDTCYQERKFTMDEIKISLKSVTIALFRLELIYFPIKIVQLYDFIRRE